MLLRLLRHNRRLSLRRQVERNVRARPGPSDEPQPPSSRRPPVELPLPHGAGDGTFTVPVVVYSFGFPSGVGGSPQLRLFANIAISADVFVLRVL